jgi:hypothetical protein
MNRRRKMSWKMPIVMPDGSMEMQDSTKPPVGTPKVEKPEVAQVVYPESSPDVIPMEAILENQAYDARADYLKLSLGLGKKNFDVNQAPPVWESMLKELIFTVAQNPRYMRSGWNIRECLMKLVKYGLMLEDMQIEGKPLPAPFTGK